MLVYLVFLEEREGENTFISVHKTKESAEACVKKSNDTRGDIGTYYFWVGATVQE